VTDIAGAGRRRRLPGVIAAILPAALTIAADVYMAHLLLNQNLWVVLRACAFFFALSLAVIIPRFGVRLVATVLMAAFTLISGFSIGVFYLPATLAAIGATVAEAVIAGDNSAERASSGNR
jgi:hypothetical protein